MIKTFLLPAAILIGFSVAAYALIVTTPTLEPTAIKPIPLSVRVQPAVKEAIQLKVHSQGAVMPSTQSQLIPEVSGRIVWTSPNLVVGGYFKAGEVLARVDELDYKNARDRAKAALNRSDAELQHAQFEYGRLQSLEERRLASRSALENSLRAYRVAQAARQDARVNFEQAQENLNRTTLRAPFNGIVRSETIDIGQFVARGQPIGTLYASDEVEVRLPIADRQLAFLNLPPTRVGTLQEAMQPQVVLSADYAGEVLQWRGRIVRTEAEIDASSRMVQLIARVDNTQTQTPLSVGLFVSAEISGLAAENVIVLPRSALRNNNQVLIVDDEKRLRYRNIQALRLYQDSVLVASGIEEGEQVCLSALQTAVEGMQVNPIIPDLIAERPNISVNTQG